MKLLVAVLSALITFINADIYIQNLRGSNNRLDEANRDRNNDDRLFDSQNNNRGGYNVGRLTHYMGENVPISWTNQHSSGTYQLKHSEIVIQYMCDYLARDGTTRSRIPINNYDCLNYDCETDVEYGRHESYWYYHQCRAHERNKGLFTANQNMNNRHAAIYTRQNPNGQRYGYECPEERDYYPYWRPSPWRDVVIYTNQEARCSKYKQQSQNVKAKWECRYEDDYWTDVLGGYASSLADLPMNHTECKMGMEVEYKNKTYNKYYLHKEASHGISAPDCYASKTTRANHHGTFGGRELWTHVWKIPDLTDDKYKKRDYTQCCVLRVRYNITTDDYQAWEADNSINAGVDYKNNTKVSNPDPDDDPAWIKIWERFGLTYEDVHQSFDGNADSDAQKRSRGYVFRDDPRVDPFGYLINSTDMAYRLQLQIAIDTTQFGRTFEDRTHCFTIRERPNNVEDGANIHLLTVQGKRGNIVQVYPATEYFFVPEPLTVQRNDYVHFCWTGSNTNPNNNDGQGKQGTDRSNICPLTEPQYDKSWYSNIDGNVDYANAGSVGDLGNSYPNFVDNPQYSDLLPDLDMLWYPHYRKYLPNKGMAGLDQNILNDLCTQRRVDQDELFDYGNMEELDDAGTTYCIKPVKVTENGRWNFLCTRNNNFSNRSQKGTLVVGYQAGNMAVTIGTVGAQYDSGSGAAIIVVNDGMVQDGSTLDIQVTTWSPPGQDSSIVEVTGSSGAEFDESVLIDDGWLELWIPYTPASLSSPKAYRRSDTSSKWKSKGFASINEKYGTSYAVININKGGFYKVENVAHVGYIIAIIVVGAVFVSVISWILFQKCIKPKK